MSVGPLRIVKVVLFLIIISQYGFSQSLDFSATPYFTASGTYLVPSDTTLEAFDFSTAPRTHPLFNDGLYYPVNDFLGNNLWVRVRHIADDPNGMTVGHNVSATASSPFRDNGFGGWYGFLFQFDVFKDKTISGIRQNILDGPFRTTILVESIETLSYPEWVYFELKDNSGSAWVLNSINFTGTNPASNPGFNKDGAPYDSPDFSEVFPSGANKISVIDLPGGAFSEFSMSANSVSRFTYGYEYPDAGGYQGMRLTFGTAALAPLISGFSPMSGPPGTTVVITGENFDPTPENNQVTVNGLPATVVASTTTTITIIVPPRATTGPINVTVFGDEAVSDDDFTVTGGLVIYNGVSPNGDEKNDFFFIENIETISPSNTVTIYNRWGDKVFTVSDYNNDSNVFKGESDGGKRLPSGTYFYKIRLTGGETHTGFLSLKF